MRGHLQQHAVLVSQQHDGGVVEPHRLHEVGATSTGRRARCPPPGGRASWSSTAPRRWPGGCRSAARGARPRPPPYAGSASGSPVGMGRARTPAASYSARNAATRSAGPVSTTDRGPLIALTCASVSRPDLVAHLLDRQPDPERGVPARPAGHARTPRASGPRAASARVRMPAMCAAATSPTECAITAAGTTPREIQQPGERDHDREQHRLGPARRDPGWPRRPRRPEDRAGCGRARSTYGASAASHSAMDAAKTGEESHEPQGHPRVLPALPREHEHRIGAAGAHGCGYRGGAGNQVIQSGQ